MRRAGDTSMGGEGREFPSTAAHWSIIMQARDRSSSAYRRAIDELCRLYWKPAYAYIRAARAFSNEEAKDLAQEFFADLVEGDLLSRYSPERGSFRAYLRGALLLYLKEHHRKANAEKRGGGRKVLALDDESCRLVETLADAAEATPDQAFDRQWEHSLLDHAVGDLYQELTRSGKPAQFLVFDRYDLNPAPGGPPTYAELAKEFGLKETDVDNALRDCRRRLRELAVLRIRGYVGTEEEVAAELGGLFSS